MITVLDCIRRIPKRLEASGANVKRNYSPLRFYLEKRQPIKKLVFIASGSSYNSAHAIKQFCETHCNLKVELEYPNLFVKYKQLWEEDSLYVVISQGGRTKYVYEALEKVKEAGKPNCSITSDTTSPIAALADVAIDMECGEEEFMYRTIGYSTSVAACFWLALTVALANGELTTNQMEVFEADYEAVIENLPLICDRAMNWYDSQRFSLLRRTKAILSGTGDLYPVANEADIKIMEMVPMMTRSFELEELIHGPQNAFDDDTIFLLFHRQGEDDEKIRSIACFLKEQIGFCAVITNQESKASMVMGDGHDLYLPVKSRYFSVLEYVTVAQVLAYRMAKDRGRDLTRGVNSCIARYITKTL